MRPVVKEIYLDIEKQLQAYGYKLYKGKIWKYDPEIGYVIGVQVELTRWGTLNDIYVCASSYRAPIKQNDFSAQKEPLPSTWLSTCRLYRRREKASVYAMGSPYQPVDITLKQQYDTLRPFLMKSVFPVLMFDADIKSYLQSMEKLQLMECEAFLGVEGVTETSLALDYCLYCDTESALRIVDLYRLYCDARIESTWESSKHLPMERRQELTGRIEQLKTESNAFEKKIRTEPEEIKRIIEENTAVSEKNCRSFFTSRFFSR